jgi:hypothetical protein
VFEYFGEGQVGDMTLTTGNAAIALHSQKGESLLLFRQVTRGLRFEGEMVYEGRHIERAPDRNGAERDAIVFDLMTASVSNDLRMPQRRQASVITGRRQRSRRRCAERARRAARCTCLIKLMVKRPPWRKADYRVAGRRERQSSEDI